MWKSKLREFKTAEEDNRSFEIFAQKNREHLTDIYPDFHAAYIWQAAPRVKPNGLIPSVSSGEKYDIPLLRRGLGQSVVKETLLFQISGSNLFGSLEGKTSAELLEAFITATQGFYAAGAISKSGGDHVYSHFFLYYVFKLRNSIPLKPDAMHQILRQDNPGIEILESQALHLSECASLFLSSKPPVELLDEAEILLRDLLVPRRTHSKFPSTWNPDDPNPTKTTGQYELVAQYKDGSAGAGVFLTVLDISTGREIGAITLNSQGRKTISMPTDGEYALRSGEQWVGLMENPGFCQIIL